MKVLLAFIAAIIFIKGAILISNNDDVSDIDKTVLFSLVLILALSA